MCNEPTTVLWTEHGPVYLVCALLCHSLPSSVWLDDRGGSGVYQEYDNPAYQDYRAEAQLQARLRHEAFQKAAAAWQANKRDLASHYAAQVGSVDSACSASVSFDVVSVCV